MNISVPATKLCPFCQEEIAATAIKCKHCQSFLDGRAQQPQIQTLVQQTSNHSRGLAAVLSFFIPGLGQIYSGRLGAGIAWLIFVVIGYFLLVVPGLILHLICIGDAYREIRM